MAENTFKTPKESAQNTVSFTCSDDAIDALLGLLTYLKFMGNAGMTREIEVDGRKYTFDGDGPHSLDYIKVNGLSLEEWDEEFDRLSKVSGGVQRTDILEAEAKVHEKTS